MTITLYSWRRKDPRTGRLRVLRWRMTDADARGWADKEGAELEKVPNSQEVRTDLDGRQGPKLGERLQPRVAAAKVGRTRNRLGALR